MNLYVRTRDQLLAQGMAAEEFTRLRRRNGLVALLPGAYCSRRRPTTEDRYYAVMLAVPGAVPTRGTAGWLYGCLPEPAVIEAYVAELPAWPLPPWLRLYPADLPGDAACRASTSAALV